MHFRWLLPKAYVPVWNLDDTVTSVAVELPDGTSQTIDFSKYAVRPGDHPTVGIIGNQSSSSPQSRSIFTATVDVIIRKCVDGNKPKR